MTVGWKDIAFVIDETLAAEIANAWEWLIGDCDWRAVLCSKLGDLFIERASGEIARLNCSTGSVERAASSRTEFDDICRSGGQQVPDWFGHGLIEALHVAGKIAGEGQCYTFITLPIFAECRYEPDNLAVVAAREVLVGLADVHRQVSELPDGEQVRIKVVE